MTKKNHAARVALEAAAYELSLEIWGGKWEHVRERNTPIGRWTVLPRELEKRCSGHTLEQYQDALSRAMIKK